jgi:tetratricopeptide (TPR) repeat protein
MAPFKSTDNKTPISYRYCCATFDLQKKNYHAAIKEFRKALREDSDCTDMIIDLARCYTQMGSYPKALRVLVNGLSKAPKNLDLLSEVGLLKIQESKFSDALVSFDKMISIDPERVDEYQLKGACLEAMGENEKALDCYKQVTGLEKGDPTMSSHICDLLLRQKKFDLAAPCIPSAIRKTNDTVSIVEDSTRALTDLPSEIRKAILASNTRIVIAPTILDDLPYLANSSPYGYPKGQTWAFVPGYYDGANITIPERIEDSKGNMAIHKESYFSTMHEIGHAYDTCKKNLSSSGQFKYCYALDCKTLNDGDKARSAYFLQPGEHGRRELFAALFELYVCRLVGNKERLGRLSLRFPHCYDFVFRKLE